MTIISLNKNDEQSILDECAHALRLGNAICIPTDTVYGLAASVKSADGIDKIFALKNRPREIELPVLVNDLPQAESMGIFPIRSKKLAERFWPGALTIVVNRQPGFDVLLGTNQDTVGIRCPDDEFVRRLCELVGPLVTTSANAHGETPCTTAQDCANSFPDVLIVDGGVRNAPPSSVVQEIDGDLKILRAGAISESQLWNE